LSTAAKKRKNWIKVPNERDIYINLICKKCEKIIDKSSEFFVSGDDPKIYCSDCKRTVIQSGKQLTQRKIEDLNKKAICQILEQKKASKFIFGKDLYINFAILVSNYRDKIEFCNY
jgi:hypothetical protein